MVKEDEKLQRLLELTQKKLDKDDICADIYKPTDIGIASYIPHTISSGLAELDLQLGGRGGLPAGRLIEYYGFEMSGKTTGALHALAEVQKLGGIGLFIDAEHTFSPTRAKQCGVDLDRLQVISAHSVESIFGGAEAFIENIEAVKLNVPCLIVVDSVTGTHVESETDADFSKDQRVGHEAKQIRRGVKRLHGMLARTKICCILINHAIASNLTMAFGKKSQAAGGHGAKIMATIRIEFKNMGRIGKADSREGQKIKMIIEKLKNAQLSQTEVADVNLKVNGFDQALSLINAGVRTKWVTEKNKVYTLQVGEDERQFKLDEWPGIIDVLGGYDSVYQMWLTKAREDGYIQLWSEAW